MITPACPTAEVQQIVSVGVANVGMLATDATLTIYDGGTAP